MMPVAKPLVFRALLTVATVLSVELHVADRVKFWVLPSGKCPVAVNCNFPPTAMLGVAGVTSIELKAGVITVSVVLPDLPPKVAVIVVEPTPTDVASPLVWVPLLITAAPVFEELQVTCLVKSTCVVSENIPVAVY